MNGDHQSLDPRLLLILRAIEETGSINRAAEVSGLSQPALSKKLSLLEKRYEISLVKRSRAGSELTDFGRTLAASGQMIEAELRRIQRSLHAARSANAAQLIIGTLPIGEPHLLPAAINAYLAKDADFHCKIFDAPISDLNEAIVNGHVDLLLGPLDAVAGENESDIEGIHLFDDKIIAVARPDHPIVRSGTTRLTDCAGSRWILPPEGLNLRVQIDEIFESEGLAPRKVVECRQFSLARALSVSGDWILILPFQMLLDDLLNGALCTTGINLELPSRSVGLSRSSSSVSRAATHGFVRCLETEAQRICSLQASLLRQNN